jgi:hypothetical protein
MNRYSDGLAAPTPMARADPMVMARLAIRGRGNWSLEVARKPRSATATGSDVRLRGAEKKNNAASRSCDVLHDSCGGIAIHWCQCVWIEWIRWSRTDPLWCWWFLCARRG